MSEQFFTSNGSIFKFPLFDPLVAEHFRKRSSYVDTLLDQIDTGMYADLFGFKKNLVFLDIGANIGLVSAYAAPACKRIVAVEPSPRVFPVLLSMTSSLKNIEAINFALSPTDLECEFFMNDINSTASSTVNTYGKRVMVQGLTLFRILQIYQLEHVDVCKIDAEGAEGESLSNYEIGICAPIIKTYWIEMHNCPKTTWEHKLGTIAGNLARYGYHEMKINGMALTATRA